MDSEVKPGELSPETKFGLSLLELSPYPVGVLQDYKYLDCNDTMLNMYGLKSKREIRGQPVGGRFSPEKQPNNEYSAAAMKMHMDDCLKTGEASFSWVSQNLDGQLIYSNIDLRRLNHFDKSLILLFYKDISAYVAARKELLESENRFNALAVNAPVGIYIADEHANCLFANPKMRELAGVTDESIMGQSWARQIHPDDLGKFIDSWEALSTGTGQFNLNFRFIPDGKKEVWVSSNAISIERVSGGPARFIGTATDITEIIRFEQQLEKSRDEAEKANQAKTRFVSHMSHELRTPLNAVLGFGQLLQLNSSELRPEQREAIDHILAGGEHLLSLIEDILDLSSIESGKLAITMQPIETHPVLLRTIAMVSPMADRKDIQIQFPKAPLPKVLADPQRLQQVLVNLLSNAIKYNHHGGFVGIQCEDTGNDQLRIEVVDNGKGIHPQFHSQLFKPFERFRAGNETIEGSGIGLSLSQLLMDKMGGRIYFSSEYGKGSSFWIDLNKAENDGLDAAIG